MKKVLSLILCGVLMMGVLMMASGCGAASESKKLVGTWEATLELGDMMMDTISSDADTKEVFGDMNLDGFTFVLRYTFNTDGTYEAEFDEDSVDEALDSLKGEMTDAIEAYLEEVIEENALDMTVDEALAQMDVDVDEMVDEMFDGIKDTMTEEGEYEAEDGKLYTFEEGDERDDDEYIKYELDGKELVFKKMVTEDEDGAEFAEAVFPITFEKAD